MITQILIYLKIYEMSIWSLFPALTPYVIIRFEYNDMKSKLVSITLSEHKIKKQQKSRAIKGLEAIHKHDILHNDIREENILISDNSNIFLIDFEMANQKDVKKKKKLFEE